jgi:hypothetical protein
MHKKLMMACMAIAAFAAFVIAPAALASPVLTNGGVAVGVGTELTGKNTLNTKFTSSLTVECSNADLTGKVTKNSGTEIAGEILVGGALFTGTGTGGDCTSSGIFNAPTAVTVNSKLCLATVPKTDNVTITGCGANIAFTLNLTGIGPCLYESSTVLGTFVTNAGATVNVSEQEVKYTGSGGTFCPGSGKLDMDLDLYTKGGGTQLTIS